MCVCVCVFFCVCACVVIHRQTVSLYHKSSVWIDKQNASSRDRYPPTFSLGLVSYHSATGHLRHLGNYNALCISFRLFTFFALPGAVVLDSLKELCIIRVAVVNSFARVLNRWDGRVYIRTVLMLSLKVSKIKSTYEYSFKFQKFYTFAYHSTFIQIIFLFFGYHYLVFIYLYI